LSGEDEGIWGWRHYLIAVWNKVAAQWCLQCACSTDKKASEGKKKEAKPSVKDEKSEVTLKESERDVSSRGETDGVDEKKAAESCKRIF